VLILLFYRLVAAAVLVEFWLTINSAIWITIFGVLMIISSSLFVRIFGELEFWFAMMKIALIVGLNIMVGGTTSAPELS
jgi:amino acid transporter